MRRRPTWRARLIRQVKPIALFDAALFAETGLICLLFGPCTLFRYGIVLLLASSLLMAVGVLGLFGGWGQTRGFGYQYALSAGGQSMAERAQREINDVNQSSGFMARAFLLGLVPGLISIGLLITGV